MPELPEVQSICNSLAESIIGEVIHRVIVRESGLRWEVDAHGLNRLVGGRCVSSIGRRAKYILVHLEGGVILMIHLGMSGRLGLQPSGSPLAKHDHVVFELGGGRELRYNDPRRFGMVEAFEKSHYWTHPRLVHLGVEPLEGEFEGEVLYRLSRKSRVAVKSFIMDARRVVGVGNIYASEALFAAGINPKTRAGRLGLSRCVRLVECIKEILNRAVLSGGTTLRDFANLDGESGYFSEQLQVYGREGEGCPGCGSGIRRVVQSNRSTYYCVKCQR